MTTKSPTFWTRLAGALRIRRRRDDQLHDLPEVGDDGLLAEPAEPPGDAEPPTGKPTGPLARWTKRDQTLARLQEGYEQVTEVIEQIRNHLVTHAERSERICTSLEQLARSMSDVPGISRQQAQTLEAIVSQLEATSTRTQQLTEVMSEVPKVARAQAETLTGMNRQLEMAGEQSVLASQTMGKVGTAINMLGESHQAQSQALKQMDDKASRQNELLGQLIARQSRRFMMLFIVTMILAAAAITLGIFGLAFRAG